MLFDPFEYVVSVTINRFVTGLCGDDRDVNPVDDWPDDDWYDDDDDDDEWVEEDDQ